MARKPQRILLAACIAGATLTMLDAPAATAQSQGGAQASSGGLEEIIVTAERREKSLQETPISISALPAEVLQDRGITDFAGVARLSPSISVTPYPSSNNTLILYMRGQGVADAAQITSDSAVGLYQDGFYLSRAQVVTFDLADVERVEVLRGPQGTLYGRNTTGGAVNMISKKPTGELGFKQELGFGSEGRFRSLSALDLPAAGGLKAKLSFLRRQQDGFVENPGGEHNFGEEEQTAGRVALRWDDGGPFTADLFYEHGNMGSTPNYYVNDALAFIPGYSSDGEPEDEAYRTFDLKKSDADFDNTGLTLSWEVSDSLTLRSLTGYRDVTTEWSQDYGDSFFVGFRTLDDVEFDHFSQELQALGTLFDDRIDYLVGLYYFEEQGDHFQNLVIRDLPTFPFDPLLRLSKDRDVSAEAESKAIFAQLTWTPPVADDRLDITVGGRYTEDERQAERSLQNRFRLMDPASPSYVEAAPFCDFVTVFSNCDLVIGQEPGPGLVTSASTESSKFNSAATLNYRWTDEISTYVRWATGYKSGGASESVDVGQLGRTYEPENVTTWELGLKSFLLDRKLRLNAAVFDSEYDDAQLFFNTNPFDLSIVTALNAGKASVSGLELEAVLQPVESLRISFDYSYLDATYDEVIAPAGTTFDPASNPFSPYRVGDNVAAVFTMPYAPEHSYNLALDWEFARLASSSLSLIMNYRWEDRVYLSAPVGKVVPGRELYSRPPTGLLDVRLSWQIDFANDHSGRIDVYANNVLDEKWEAHLIANGAAIPVPAPDGSASPPGYTSQDIAWSERQTFGVNLIYEF